MREIIHESTCDLCNAKYTARDHNGTTKNILTVYVGIKDCVGPIWCIDLCEKCLSKLRKVLKDFAPNYYFEDE